MAQTKLLYLENFNILEQSATVLDVFLENDKQLVILDQTIFYPQGGGQPYDTGIIKNERAEFLVKEVRFVDGIVKHIGTFKNPKQIFHKNDNILCLVDKERRFFHSKLHSGGHIVDMAVDSLKYEWTPGKGYHFADGPYVEYTGNLENLDKEMVKRDIENRSNQFIQENLKTKLCFMDKESMKQVCRHVPDYIPNNNPSRVVLYGNFGVPCGSTHVNNLGEIESIHIRNIKQKGSTIRVGYEIK